MSLKTFSAVFLALCCMVAAGTLATYRPAAVATAAAPAADDLVGYGKRLVAQTFAEMEPGGRIDDKAWAEVEAELKRRDLADLEKTAAEIQQTIKRQDA